MTRLSAIATMCGSAVAQCDQWQSLGLGTSGFVPALAVYKGNLIAGGQFTSAGGGPANYIARWNETTGAWLPLGSGMNDFVTSLTVYHDELIAGGRFSVAGGTVVNGIARWDGSMWRPLGTGMNFPVFGLTVYNGELIASGDFTMAGGTPADHIARWNGSIWQPMGSVGFGGLFGFTVYSNQLYGAGFAIETWTGSAWQTVPVYFNGRPVIVGPLAVYGGELILGGSFESVTGMSANNITRWNGVVWQSLGSGVNGETPVGARVRRLMIYNGDLIAGGYFTTAGGQSASAIARWNGAAWQSLGFGVGDVPELIPEVAAMTIYNNELIIGGSFTTAGGQPASNIARWRDCHMCLADVTHDSQVNIDDLVNVITAWGPCPPQPLWCPADLAPLGGNGVVNMDDLVKVLQGWNSCCEGDVTHDGLGNIDDLVAVLTAWGPCPAPPPPIPICPADITRSGAVNIDDLVAVITAWGPCP